MSTRPLMCGHFLLIMVETVAQPRLYLLWYYVEVYDYFFQSLSYIIYIIIFIFWQKFSYIKITELDWIVFKRVYNPF